MCFKLDQTEAAISRNFGTFDPTWQAYLCPKATKFILLVTIWDLNYLGSSYACWVALLKCVQILKCSRQVISVSRPIVQQYFCPKFTGSGPHFIRQMYRVGVMLQKVDS